MNGFDVTARHDEIELPGSVLQVRHLEQTKRLIRISEAQLISRRERDVQLLALGIRQGRGGDYGAGPLTSVLDLIQNQDVERRKSRFKHKIGFCRIFFSRNFFFDQKHIHRIELICLANVRVTHTQHAVGP